MASEKKKRKLKNSHGCASFLKDKLPKGVKRVSFFTPSRRRVDKKVESD